MEAFLCACPAITIGPPLRSPLLPRQAGAPVSRPRTSLLLPFATVSRSRTPGLDRSGARGGLMRARAAPEDDSSTATFGYFAASPKAGTETVKEATVEKDDAEAPPAVTEDVPAVEQLGPINFFDQLDIPMKIATWIQSAPDTHESVQHLLEDCHRRWMFKGERLIWWLILHATLWALWGERNNKIVRREARDADRVVSFICERVGQPSWHKPQNSSFFCFAGG